MAHSKRLHAMCNTGLYLIKLYVVRRLKFLSNTTFGKQDLLPPAVNRLNFVTVKCGVFFAVRTELLNIT
jgi:hypothetical protein